MSAGKEPLRASKIAVPSALGLNRRDLDGRGPAHAHPPLVTFPESRSANMPSSLGVPTLESGTDLVKKNIAGGGRELVVNVANLLHQFGGLCWLDFAS